MSIFTYFIKEQETSALATANYRTIDTAAIQSAEIPKYSTIINAHLGIKIKSSLSAKGGLYLAFSNRTGGNGEPNGTKIKDFGDVIGNSVYVGDADVTKYIHSNNANAGKYNGSYPYLLYWAHATIARRWTLGEFCIYYNIAKPTYQINVSSNNTAWGTVSGSGTWDVETADFTKTITAVPNAHYHFVKWDDGNTNATRSLTISQNGISSHTTTKSYTAIFAPDTYTVTTNTNGNGTVTGSGAYEYGKSVTLTATPNTGYKFVKWSDGDTNNPRIVTVTGEATYTAQFEPVGRVFSAYRGTTEYSVKGYIGTTEVQGYIGTTRVF